MSSRRGSEDTNSRRPASPWCGRAQGEDVFSDYCDAVSGDEYYSKNNEEESFHDAPELREAMKGGPGVESGGRWGPGPDEGPKRTPVSAGKRLSERRLRKPAVVLARRQHIWDGQHRKEKAGAAEPKRNSVLRKKSKEKSIGEIELTEDKFKENNLHLRTVNNQKFEKQEKATPISKGKKKGNKNLDNIQINPASRGRMPDLQKLLGNIKEYRKQSKSVNTLIRNKVKHTSVEAINNDRPVNDISSTGAEKGRKPNSVKSRIEEIKTLKEKIALARSTSREEKNAVNNKFTNNQSVNNEIVILKPCNEDAFKGSMVEIKKMPNVILYKSELCTGESSILCQSGAINTAKNQRKYVAVNTDPTPENECIAQLKKEKEEQVLQGICLQNENGALQEMVSEMKIKEADLKKDLTTTSEAFLKLSQTVKDLENKLLEKDVSLKQLRITVSKMSSSNEKLKEKEVKVSVLENKLSCMTEDSSNLKKELEKIKAERELLTKERDSMRNTIAKLEVEYDESKLKNLEFKCKLSEMESEEKRLCQELEDEREKNKNLLENQKANELGIFEFARNDSYSASIVGFSEQLIQKDVIISDLEKLRDNVQLLNREFCVIISAVFRDLGKCKTESEIESLISSGKGHLIKKDLLSLLENSSSKTENVHEECRRVIFNLENRAAMLEAELEESKHLSETLAVISSEKMWGVDAQNQVEIQEEEEEVEDCSFDWQQLEENQIGDTCDLPFLLSAGKLPQNHYELHILLETKRRALMRMERKVQELEEVHANCSRKRVRNEMRIDQLEMALAELTLTH